MKTDMRYVRQLEKEVQRLRIAVDELIVLNDLAVAASSSMDVKQMLDIIIQKSMKAVKAEQGSISLVTEQEEIPFRTLVRQVDRTHDQMPYHVGTHFKGWVLKYKKPLIIENLTTDDRFKASKQELKEIRSVLCVPIWCQAKIIGILIMMNKKTQEPFTTDDQRLLAIIAAQSGQLIRNSQLQEEAVEKQRLEYELNLASRIQNSLLPDETPMNSELDISSYFHPTEAVGGDYYDYFVLGDKLLGVAIADVSGHGPAAAMVMTLIKGILHSISLQYSSVQKFLEDVNSILTRIVPKKMFISMMFLVFDLKKKILHFSSAGHNPIIYYKKSSRTCEMIELKGTALNLKKNCTYLAKEIALESEDVFFIYTDGITEASNAKREMFEETALLQSVQEVASRTAHEIIDHVKSRLYDFIGKMRLTDDALMIVIKIK